MDAIYNSCNPEPTRAGKYSSLLSFTTDSLLHFFQHCESYQHSFIVGITPIFCSTLGYFCIPLGRNLVVSVLALKPRNTEEIGIIYCLNINPIFEGNLQHSTEI